MRITTFSFIQAHVLKQKFPQFNIYLSDNKRIFKLCKDKKFENAFLIKDNKQICDCLIDKFQYLVLDLKTLNIKIDKNYRDQKINISKRPMVKPIIVRQNKND